MTTKFPKCTNFPPWNILRSRSTLFAGTRTTHSRPCAARSFSRSGSRRALALTVTFQVMKQIQKKNRLILALNVLAFDVAFPLRPLCSVKKCLIHFIQCQKCLAPSIQCLIHALRAFLGPAEPRRVAAEGGLPAGGHQRDPRVLVRPQQPRGEANSRATQRPCLDTIEGGRKRVADILLT